MGVSVVGRNVAARGYSLVELLVVMAMLGVLATAAYPMAEILAQREREAELKRALWELRDAIDSYKRAADREEIAVQPGSSGYPPNLGVLVAGVPDVNQGGRPRYFLRRIPRDPFADPALPADQTWGLRSFESPPDRPRPGADVYDVYSQTERHALDGRPLRTW